MGKRITVLEIAELVGGTLGCSDADAASRKIEGVAAVGEARPSEITFLGNLRYLHALRQSRAGAVFVPEDFSEEIPPITIRVANPSVAFAKIVALFAPPPIAAVAGIHPSAVIGEDVILGEGISVGPHAVIEPGAKLGPGTVIGANCYLGHRVKVGAQCHLYPSVVIREGCLLGDRVTIHSGAVLGSDGFGYEQVDGCHVKIPQSGIVQVDDDVEIGANATIDRARFGRTWIQEGSKIDNLVQVGHNVTVGRHCVIVAQTGISGSTKLGNHVILAGQVGLAGHIELGDRVIVGAKSGVSKNIAPGERWFGAPAVPDRDFKRTRALVNRLEDLVRRLKRLEQVSGLDEKSSK
jgi:UDP-3-O-[3-hydroxymyristoyl] glucosamine N-acyltransferase